MEKIYDNAVDVKTLSSRSSAKQEGPRRLLRASVLGLGLLSVFLLAGLIGLAVHYHNSVRGAAADLSAVKANLTERLQASDQQLSSVTEERERLKANLTEKTKEVDRLQSLMDKEKTCPAGWRKFGCSCYLFSTEKASWEQSRDNCRAGGAHLVIVDSDEEQEFITSMTNEETWIGLSNREEEGTWKWVDGSPLTLTFWDAIPPDNGGGHPKYGEEDKFEEDCANIHRHTKSWNDQSCRDNVHWICEKEA